MPELIEVELYRLLAARIIGRTVASVVAPDPWYLKGGLDGPALAAAIVGGSVGGVRRRGKLLLVELDGRPTLGLRFGMTGRLVVDGEAAITRLEYSSARDDPAWDRLTLTFERGGCLVVSDPRRLGGVSLDPDESALGPDAASIDVGRLAGVLAGGAGPLKARLMDQKRLAGLGNLLTDEILWRAGLSPRRAAGGLGPGELASLAETVSATVAELQQRGGSHTGDLHDARRRGGVCPRDGVPLRRDQVGGRTTIWCEAHQR